MTEIECARCGHKKAASAFPRNASKATGRDQPCLRCKRDKDGTHEAREAKRFAAIFRKYGITAEQYQVLLNNQSGLCQICCYPESKTNRFGETLPLAVDHDHDTKAVRGLLCSSCNRGIGLFEDDIWTVGRAYAYLGGRL